MHVGCNVATNAAGGGAVRVGMMRALVLGHQPTALALMTHIVIAYNAAELQKSIDVEVANGP